MARFYTADPHFSHTNIIRYCDRPYRDTDEMNAALVANINAVAGADDELWILGDLALGKLDESLAWVGKIAATVHLVIGNHERCFERPGVSETKLAKARRTRERYLEAGIASLTAETTHEIGGRQVVLSHFPYAGDHTDEDRYAAARPVDRGNWLLCGHVHDAWTQRGRQVNVGVDVRGYAPVAEHDIIEILRQGPRDVG